jgi:hypothetical protein
MAGDLERPGVVPVSVAGEATSAVGPFPVSDILSDPERFQSRAAYPRDARDTDFSDLTVFNDLFANVLSVWRDPRSREVYVVDGHRRLELARRTGTATVLVSSSPPKQTARPSLEASS